ncbi:MAG: pilus assembly PilX N-terminal domain-containing protein [Colwelliaceae bacterium]|nr:pilus assembly PilX N-terminal domain-containing protein [Colwelliaceae bacterium]
MFHKNNSTCNKKQSGSALVIAIFVIVVMTLLGTALVRMINSSAETVVYEVIGTRAFQAAQIGLQRKLQELYPLLPASGTCLVTPEFDLSTVVGLENCKAINVTCSIDATVAGVTYYSVKSTGQCEISGVLTSRTLEVQSREL